MDNHRKGIIPRVLLCLTLLSSSISLQVRVESPAGVPGSINELRDRSNIRLSINSGDRFIHPKVGTTFEIPPLVTSRSLIEVVSNVYLYPILIVDQRPSGHSEHSQRPGRTFSLMNPVTRKIYDTAHQPIVLRPVEKINYFDAEGGFSIIGMLTSGTGLMLLFGVFMFFCYQKLMPKLQEAQEAA